MIEILDADFSILPPNEKMLWPDLGPALELGFVLYGGTAIALQLGHRTSIDFYFSSDRAFTEATIAKAFSFFSRSTVLQSQENSVTLSVPCEPSQESRHVNVSFSGGLSIGRCNNPSITRDKIIEVASLDDLMATKLKIVPQRARLNDYLDIGEMIASGANLSRGMAAARLLYGNRFQPSECLRALCYFGDGDLQNLPESTRKLLTSECKKISDLPEVKRIAHSLTSSGRSSDALSNDPTMS